MIIPEGLEFELHEDAKALQRRGHGDDAARVKAIANALTEALDPIRLVIESDAILRTGKTRRWLIDRFDAWLLVGAAEMRDGVRWYRLCVLPARTAFAQGAADAEARLRAS